MDTKLKEFCQLYQEKLKNDLDILNNKIEAINDNRKRIAFTLTFSEQIQNCFSSFNFSNKLIVLDKEDLEYFYNKYSKLLEKELEEKIKNLKESYKQIIKI